MGYAFFGALMGFGIGLKVGYEKAIKELRRQIAFFDKELINKWNKNQE
jgi:hypothetical protein